MTTTPSCAGEPRNARPIEVELYGIPRKRCGTDRVAIPTGGRALDLGAVLAWLGASFPDFASDCLSGAQLRSPFVANVGGRRFVSHPETELQPGDRLLVMSSSAGG